MSNDDPQNLEEELSEEDIIFSEYDDLWAKYKHQKFASTKDRDTFIKHVLWTEDYEKVIKKIHEASLFNIGRMRPGKNPRKVLKAPGYNMLRVCELAFGRKLKELIFEPILADMHQEYFEELKQGEHIKSKLVLIRYYLFILTSTALKALGSSLIKGLTVFLKIL